MNDTPQRPGEDDQLRRLLHDTVDDVQPAHALGTIRARTTRGSRARRGWLLGAGGAVLATAATVAAVAVLTDPGTSRDPGVAGPGPSVAASPSTDVSGIPSDTAPTPSPSPATPSESAPPAAEAMTVPVYYLGETTRGPRLFREFHRVPGDGNALMAALTEAVSAGPEDPDYRTDWPSGTTVALAGVDEGQNGQIFVTLRNDTTDLRFRPRGMTPEEAQSSVEQLIYTAQATVQTRAPVQFLLERDGAAGTRVDTLLSVPVSEPLAEGDAARTLAQVWIIDPAEGARVSPPFEVSGVAAAFEANVLWELRDGDTVVKEGFTTARECCTMAPYSFEVTAPPGEYTLVVQDSDPSDGEGLGPWQDTKRVTVVP